MKKVDENTGNAMVEYVVQKKVSKEVNPNRIVCATLDNISRSRSPDDGNDDRPTLPSLLSPNYLPARRLQELASKSKDVLPSKRNGKKNTLELLKQPPLMSYQYMERQREVGWLRKVETPSYDPDDNKQLTSKERNNVSVLKRYLTGVPGVKAPTIELAKAFGVSERTIRGIGAKVDQRRKKRVDAGSNVLTSAKKQRQVFTGLQVFKKLRRRETRDGDVDRYTDTELRAMCEQLPDDQKKSHSTIADSQKNRMAFLIGDIQQILAHTEGTMTFKQIETAIADDNIPILSKTTLRNILMGLPNSQYKSTRIMPSLTESHKKRRYAY